MTRSVKNAKGSSLRCIDDNASFARALSSVNSDFQNFEAASPCLIIRRGHYGSDRCARVAATTVSFIKGLRCLYLRDTATAAPLGCLSLPAASAGLVHP